MVKRYEGNSGRVEILPDARARESVTPSLPPRSAPPSRAPGITLPAPGPLGELGRMLPEKLLQPLRELEAGDLLMIAVLYLLYRESGDTELLLILAAMLFL